MRVVQQLPAWSLHAYMRFLGLEYSSENSVTYQALGLPLPVIVDAVNVKNDTLAMTYLSKVYGNVESEMSSDTVFAVYLKQSLVGALRQIEKHRGTATKNVFRTMPAGLQLPAYSFLNARNLFYGEG
jgi:hypothetical protein